MSNHTILQVMSSNRDGSVSNEILDYVSNQLATTTPGSNILRRDVSNGFDAVSNQWIQANFTPADDRNAEQKQALALSDSLVAELQSADTIVIGVPIHNFSVPTALKSWIDMIARAGVTFKYTENGPQGLLEGKKAILVVTAGGVEPESPADFATPYMKHVLGFVGISDVDVIHAGARRSDGQEQKQGALAEADKLLAA